MDIEELKINDVAEAREVLVKTWLDTYQSLLPKETIEEAIANWHSIENLTKNIKNPDIYFAVYKEAGKIVGLVTASKVGKDTLQVFRLYVLPEEQRRGIGSQLFSAAIAHFPKISKVRVEVEEANRKAISFYEKRRFKKVGQKILKVGKKTIPAIIEELLLD